MLNANIAQRDNKELLKEASTDTDIMINGGLQVSTTLFYPSTTDVSTKTPLQNASDTEISGTAEITDPYVDDNIDDGAQVSATINFYCINNSGAKHIRRWAQRS